MGRNVHNESTTKPEDKQPAPPPANVPSSHEPPPPPPPAAEGAPQGGASGDPDALPRREDGALVQPSRGRAAPQAYIADAGFWDGKEDTARDPNARRAAPPPRVVRARVLRECKVNTANGIATLQEGQIVDSNNYDLEALHRAGVRLGDPDEVV